MNRISLLITTLFLATLALGPANAETFIVNSTDDVDDATCDTIHCSLREAIQAANDTAGSDIIQFDDVLAGATITPTVDLPEITEAVTIDATTLTGFTCQSAMQLMIDGSTSTDGLIIASTASGSVIRGLTLGSFGSGRAIQIFSDDNVVQCNFIGTDLTGLVSTKNVTGIFLGQSASNNLIGTNGDGVDDTAERNVISGNVSVGVVIDGQEAINSSLPLPEGNTIAGNYIGPGVDGVTEVGNGLGVILTATNDNIVGTNGDGNGFDGNEGNVVAGNTETGVFVAGNASSDMPDPVKDLSAGNVIAGNLIGVDATGNTELPNGTTVSVPTPTASRTISNAM